MDCREVLENLSLYLDNYVDSEEKRKIEKHLAECPSCREEMAGLQAATTVLQTMGEVSPPADWRGELMQKLAEPAEKKGFAGRIGGFIRSYGKYSTFAAMLVLALGLGTWWTINNFGGGIQSFTLQDKMTKAEMPNSTESLNSIESNEFKLKSNYRHSVSESASDTDEATLGSRGAEPSAGESAAQKGEEKLLAKGPDSKEAVSNVPPAYDRKIVTKGDLYLEVKNFDKTVSEVDKITAEAKGYIQASTVEDIDDAKQARYTLRLPVKGFLPAVEKLKKLGNVKHVAQSGDDVSKEYYDTDGRLKAMREQENRLLALVKQGKNLQDVLAVEQELGRIRQEIESLQGQLNYLNNVTGMATLELTLRQVDPSQVTIDKPDNLGERFIAAVLMNTNRLLKLLASLVVTIGAFLPYLILLAGIGAVIYLVRRRKKG